MPKDVKAEVKIKLATVAKLGNGDIFLGTEEIMEESLTPEHVHLPNGCDLSPEKYYWDRKKGTFLPLTEGGKSVRNQPEAVNAIAIGFISLLKQGNTLPVETILWLDYHLSTIDAAGCCIDEDTAKMVVDFKNRKVK